MRPATLLLTLLLAFPATAQEKPSFTPEDAEQMTACVADLSETVPAGQNPPTDCVGAASNACMESEEDGTTTIGMTRCMARETAWWDGQLNVHYASLEETLAPELFATLRDAQRSWIDYRDASCGFEYELWSEGTIRSTVFAGCMMKLTAQRAQALERYATRTP